ncbi:MAG: tellurite resistance TerB family protein [Candidatus Krumholzibacteriia bacterium]
MLSGIRGFFSAHVAPASPGAPERRLEVAVCALLLEAAHADAEFSASERDLVGTLLAERFSLAGPEVGELMALAEAERARSADLYGFTRLIAEAYDDAGKLALLEMLWRVIYSDGRLEAHEDALMHKLAHLLGLKHADLIALKLRVKGREGGSGSAAPSSGD